MENNNPNAKKAERIRVNGMDFEIRPKWKDNDVEKDKYKLIPEKQLEKRIQRVSKNHRKASSEYRAYLESLRSDERIFWSLCRSVSPVRSSSKERQRPRTSSLKGRSTDDRAAQAGRVSSSGDGNPKTSSGVEKEPSHRGRSGRTQDSKERGICSLPPALDSNGSSADLQSTENSIEVDLYLTRVKLQSCIESYSRRLYNICRMVDLDSEQEDFLEETYFEDASYGLPNRDTRDWQTEDCTKEQPESFIGPAKAKDKTPKSRPNAQPQVSSETISETASKWSARLRSDLISGGSPGLDAGRDSDSHSPAKLSKATRSRLSLKEKISKASLSGADLGLAGVCSRGDGTTSPASGGDRPPVANVVLTQSSNISKQPFSSLFNI